MITLKNLTKHLIQSLLANEPVEFPIWKSFWIAANGPLDRKKTTKISEVADFYGISNDSLDSYKLSFAIETALASFSIILKNEFFSKKEVDYPLAEMPSERLFLWAINSGQSELLDAYGDIRNQLDGLGSAEAIWRWVLSDRVRDLYHDLLPKSVRHTMGAYFSPPSLCDRAIAECELFESSQYSLKRILEPNSGMGAFLLATIRSVAHDDRVKELDTRRIEESISEAFVGIEKNIGTYVVGKNIARIALNKYVVAAERIREPRFYWADSIYIDSERINASTGHIDTPNRHSTFLIANFLISNALVATQGPDKVLQSNDPDDIVVEEFVPLGSESWIQSGHTIKRTLDNIQSEMLAAVVSEGLDNLATVERLGTFDVIVGNPPWINWENIDPIFRARILPMWPKLGIFAMSGRDRAFSKEDLSVLATYAALARFGKQGAFLAFLLPQSLLQSRKNSKGFRRFRLGSRGSFIRVKFVVDYSDFAEFGDAKNRTALFLSDLSDEATKYPVIYEVPVVIGKGNNRHIASFITRFARPSLPSDMESNWAIYEDGESDDSKMHIATGAYRGRTGVFTGGANAVFYVEVLSGADDSISVRNITERAKIKVPDQVFQIEGKYLFPFNRGRDLSFWHCSRPSNLGIILPHTPQTKIKPVRRELMNVQAPKTLKYLQQFDAMLASRASLTALDRANVEEAAYAVLRVGDYTFKPYKVAWKYISKDFCCAVIGPQFIAGELKPAILQEKLISIGLDSEQEAYYLCGLLSSTPVRTEIERRIVGTQVSAHVIEDISILRYDPESVIAESIATECKRGHELAARGLSIDSVISSIDNLVHQLYLKAPAHTKPPSQQLLL